MPFPTTHDILAESNPGRTHRLQELIEAADDDELTVRREIDALALSGQVKRLAVGSHIMVKKTDEFDPENPPEVEPAPTRLQPATRGLLPPSEYDLPEPGPAAAGGRLSPAPDPERPKDES